MKKVLKILGVLFLLAALAIGGCFGWLMHEQSQYSTTAVPYLKRVVPEIAHWDPNTLKNYMAPAAVAETSDAELAKLTKWFSKLGSFQSMEEPEFSKVYSGASSSTGSIKTVTYTIKAHFDGGDAFITITLLDEGLNFSIYSFNLSSKALIG